MLKVLCINYENYMGIKTIFQDTNIFTFLSFPKIIYLSIHFDS
jgi:hypothetical protein